MTRKTSGPGGLSASRVAFRQALLSWYRASRRRLPWRESPGAYSTLVSEFMLQQTQVSTVLPYFERWMKALPDFEALARAPESRVLKLWEGLGYYSRARNLQRLAREVVRLGALPSEPGQLLELAGVGPYTAAAVSSIAFGRPWACVDGNVVRILARLTRDGTPRRDSASASKAFAGLAQELLDPAAPGDHNQAMMELGATVCLKHAPHCLACPVSRLCGARAAGDPQAYPRLERRATERRSVVRVWCERRGSLLLHLNPASARRLAGIHELPTAEEAGIDADSARGGACLLKRTRGITHHVITESIHQAKAPERAASPGLVWVALADLGSVSLSGPHRRWTSQILAGRRA